MKYYIAEEGQTLEVEVEDRNEGLLVRVGDQEMLVDLRKVTEPSLFSVIIDNRSYEALVEEQEGDYNVLIDGELHRVSVQDEWARRMASIQRKNRVAEGDLSIKAPMPGVVVGLEVQTGDQVQSGQGLLILGAMKMENEIKAPRAGIVKEVKVEQGQIVEQGRVLVVLG